MPLTGFNFSLFYSMLSPYHIPPFIQIFIHTLYSSSTHYIQSCRPEEMLLESAINGLVAVLFLSSAKTEFSSTYTNARTQHLSTFAISYIVCGEYSRDINTVAYTESTSVVLLFKALL